MKQFIVALFAFASVLATPALATEVSPTKISGAVSVSTDEAKALFEDGAIFVDVRKDSDWDAGRIPGAYHIELNSEYNADALAEVAGKAETLVIYCNGSSCMRSSEACAMAVEWGFENVHYYRDGFPAWQVAGYPVE
ncbi:MAG: rhodanese-like domain-containing protein [Pseudomonadota bacterium]